MRAGAVFGMVCCSSWRWACVCLLMAGFRCIAADSGAPTSEALVRRLADPAQRVGALEELLKRGDPSAATHGRRVILDTEYLACPQPDGSLIHLVRTHSWRFPATPSPWCGFPDTDQCRVFPPDGVPPVRSSAHAREWEAVTFDAQGTPCPPFRSLLTRTGELVDLNGDGVLEWVDVIYFLPRAAGPPTREEPTRHLLVANSVIASDSPPAPLLTVILNLGEDAWGWRIHRVADGLPSVQIGPRKNREQSRASLSEPVPDSVRWDLPSPGKRLPDPVRWDLRSRGSTAMEPSELSIVGAEFRWNPATARMEGPEGSTAEHFLTVVPDADYRWKLKAFDAGLRFPTSSIPAWNPPKIVCPPTSLPFDFWWSEPRAAARALADANRGADHRELYAIGFDVEPGVRAPRNGTVTLRRASGGRPGPFTHWLIFTPADPPMIQRIEQYRATPRARELPEPIARHVFEVLWWLSRLRTDSTARESGRYVYRGFLGAALTFAPAGSDPVHFEIGAQVPRESIARGWTGAYGPEEFVAFAEFLLDRLELGDYPKDLSPAIRQTPSPTAP